LPINQKDIKNSNSNFGAKIKVWKIEKCLSVKC